MTTNPTITAVQALKQATEALFNAFEVLAASLPQVAEQQPASNELPPIGEFSEREIDETMQKAKGYRERKATREALAEAASAEKPARKESPATPTEVVRDEGATLEQIRAVLSEVSKAGRAADARALLKRLGYTKLTDIPESLYDQVLPLARELLDA